MAFIGVERYFDPHGGGGYSEETTDSPFLEETGELGQKFIPEIPSDLISPELSPNAVHVLERRYLAKNEDGKIIETPREMLWRVAYTVAKAEARYSKGEKQEERVESTARRFYEIMAGRDFLPNSPTLMNAGRPLGQLSACFVLPVEDSMEGIFEAIKAAAIIHKSGGGTGFSFSRLRPAGDVVRSTGGIASGPVSFMEVFDAATEAVKQGGTRRGANMAILRVDHPDIRNFVTAKQSGRRLTNFNTSVGLTKDFMEEVKKDGTYSLINPRSGEITEQLRAREVLREISKLAWENGDPGVIFIDKMNADNPTPQLGEIESTNPCGEQPLLPFESCNLGSINLGNFVRNGEVDFEELRKTVQTAVRFLDNVIDVNQYPLPEIRKMTLGNRKIGLGIMGLSDMLIKLRLAYDSDEAREITEKVMAFIQQEGRQASRVLAEERGTFPNFEGSIYEGKEGPLRNATITTIAPTGSISIIAGCTSGCEPPFALAFKRKHRLGEAEEDNVMWEVNPLFLKMAEEAGVVKEVVERIADPRIGMITEGDEVPNWIREVFATARQISPEAHLRIQAVLQRSTDNAVSKTVNLPHGATPEEILEIYLRAYDLGLKGVTVYRDGSREQVLSTGEEIEREEAPRGLSPRPRPRVTYGITEKVTVGCGQTIYVTVNQDKQGVLEAFATMGKSGGCMASQSEAIGRLISLALRSGIQAEAVIKQLQGIRCPAPAWQEGEIISSCPDAISKVIGRYLKKNGLYSSPSLSIETQSVIAKDLFGRCPECPDCGTMVEFADGCLRCPGCGYSQCG